MDAAIESLTSTTTDPDLVAAAARAVSGGRVVETLNTSYRSRPELVAVTSEIFARAFAHQNMPEERTRLQASLKDEPKGHALVARVLDEPGPGAFRDDPAVAAIVAARARNPDLGPVAAIDAVIAAGGARALCAGWGNSAQRLANLDALRSHAVSYVGESSASGAAITVVGLLRYLESMVEKHGWDRRRTDSQALLAEADAVTISTWHRAKGLEWPVTILFGLETLRDPQAHGTHVMTDRQGFDVADPLGGRWIRFWPNPYSNAAQNGPVKTAFQSSQAYSDLVARADREALRLLYVGWTRARDRLILAVQRGKLKGGLVGKLMEIEGALISEPDAAPAGDAHVTWAGRDVTISVVPCAPAPPVAVEKEPGTVTVGRPAIVRAPARMLPSAAPAVPSALGETVVLGKRIAVRGQQVDMTAVGNAVHGFLAADRPALLPDDRLAMAAAILKRFRVDENIEAPDVLEVASRLWRWIDARFAGARLHREWPVLSRTTAGTVLSGTADLVVTTPAGIVVIDHKTFPGMDQAALARAQTYSGQLAAYSTAICAATGSPPASTWIHFPILGQVVEVSLTVSTR